ncbi:MAG: hypothetical protein JEY94_08575 [Melioribacteraceae bacterium]|nr:hypothetical protein [Melioribacteraceae bacterium]
MFFILQFNLPYIYCRLSRYNSYDRNYTDTKLFRTGKNPDANLNQFKIEAALKYKSGNEYYEFVNPNVSLIYVIPIFGDDEKMRDKKKNEIVLITRNGTIAE